jgi:serpin B
VGKEVAMAFLRRARVEKPGSDVQAVVQGNTEFALGLYDSLMGEGGNLVFSPYSLSTALAMTHAGARGETEAQIAQALHLDPDLARSHEAFSALQTTVNAVLDRGDVRLLVANSLWPQTRYALLEEFLALARDLYDALITPVDYQLNSEAARRLINSWVDDRTEGKIKDLIGSGALNALTRLVLVNAIYFKGDWNVQFDPKFTMDAPFWITRESSVDVPMMWKTATYGYAEVAGFQVLEMPYAGKEMSMIVLLPREVDGLSQLEGSLTSSNLSTWTRRLRGQEVDVALPTFTIDWGGGLSRTLVAMGMVSPFDPQKADFSGMDGRKNWLYLSDVIHRAFIKINEQGTEAAAATAVAVTSLGGAPRHPIFRADHPFLFLVRENNSGSILFLGRVVNPK